MTPTALLFRSLLFTLLVQAVLSGPAAAAEAPARHRLLLFYSANVFGELEPCGG